MKKMKTPRLATVIATATVTDRLGTNTPAGSPASRTVRRTRMQYRKSATNTPSATWLPRSRMKLRRSRGPNWTEARVIATIMIEKTSLATDRRNDDRRGTGGAGVSQFDLPLEELLLYRPERMEPGDFDQFWHDSI